MRCTADPLTLKSKSCLHFTSVRDGGHTKTGLYRFPWSVYTHNYPLNHATPFQFYPKLFNSTFNAVELTLAAEISDLTEVTQTHHAPGAAILDCAPGGTRNNISVLIFLTKLGNP